MELRKNYIITDFFKWKIPKDSLLMVEPPASIDNNKYSPDCNNHYYITDNSLKVTTSFHEYNHYPESLDVEEFVDEYIKSQLEILERDGKENITNFKKVRQGSCVIVSFESVDNKNGIDIFTSHLSMFKDYKEIVIVRTGHISNKDIINISSILSF